MRQEKQDETLKVPRRVRGTLVAKGGDSYEFIPQGEGMPTQTDVRKAGDAKLYKTTSEKKPRLVAHLSVPSDAVAPVAALRKQLEEVTTGMQTKVEWKPTGRLLLKDDAVQVNLDPKKQEVFVGLHIDLSTTNDCTTRLLNLMQRVSQCFAINQTYLVRRSS